MIAYKLFRLRVDGTLGPLFINRSQVVPTDKWLWYGKHETKGFAFRPGWHCCAAPSAPHLKENPAQGRRVWARVEVRYVEEFKRPANQGEVWFLAKRMKVLEVLTDV